MFDFLRRDQPADAMVYFAGSAPPAADAFGRLRSKGYELAEGRSDEAIWILDLKHPVHGDAQLACLRDTPRIDDAIRFAGNITDSERQAATGASSAVWLRIPAHRREILRDRKTLLRIARDVLGDDGVMVLDMSSQLPWSRASLEDELAHDADLDIEALYCIHNVLDDDSPDPGRATVLWTHTHGLERLGRFDIDIVAPDRTFADTCGEMLRGIAMGVLEGTIGPDERRFTFGHPGGDARFVPATDFQRDADVQFTRLRDADEHGDRRSVMCEPVGRKILGFGRGDRPEPLRFARQPPPDQFVVFFTNAMTTLISERAKATLDILRSLMAEFAEFEVVAIVKLGYPTPDDGREHLWFTAHGIGAETIDATLENKPFVADLRPGERAERPIELLTDWMLMTPVGSITPRSMSAARSLRENAAEIRTLIADGRDRTALEPPGVEDSAQPS